MPQFSQEKAEMFFSEAQCLLLDKYKNTYTPVLFMCRCGNFDTITLDLFRSKQKCKKCRKTVRSNKKLTIEEARQIFSSKGFKLLATEYANSATNMDYICSCGTISKISLNCVKAGRSCKKCGYKKNSLSLTIPFEEVNAVFESSGCKILNPEQYKNNMKPLKYICVCGKIGIATLKRFRAGSRCRNCAALKRSGEKNNFWRHDRDTMAYEFAIRQKCTRLIANTRKKKNGGKLSGSEKILGYTKEDLETHLNNHPNMAHLRGKEWEIDHYFPVKAFFVKQIYDLKLINCLENLQPMTSEENTIKGASYSEADFLEWLKRKGFTNVK